MEGRVGVDGRWVHGVWTDHQMDGDGAGRWVNGRGDGEWVYGSVGG